MTKLRLCIAAFIVAFGCALLFTGDNSYAVTGPCYFNTTTGPVVGTSGCGESGYGDYGTNDIFTGRNSSGGGAAIPGSINTKGEFINYVLNRFNNGGTHDRIGAAFTMQSMRGSRAWPSAAARDDWEMRMRLPGVSFWRGWDSSVGDTSYYDDDKKNVFYGDHRNVGREVIRIRDGSGNLIAEIETPCGNMVLHSYRDLPTPPQWTITPASSVSVAHPRPGDTVTYASNSHNNGPDDTDKTVTMTMQRSVNGGGWSNRGSWNKGSGWNNGTNFGTNKTDTWTPSQGDDGKRVCQRTVVDPRAWNNGSALASAQDCAEAWQKWQVAASTSKTAQGDAYGPRPGQNITWTHTLTNSGPDWTSAAVGWNVQHTPATPNTETTYNSGSIAKNWQVGAANKKTFTNVYTVTSADAGKNLCQYITANPSQRLAWNDSPNSTVSSSDPSDCQMIPYDYELIPSIATNPNTPSEVDTPLDINPSVNNLGPTQSQTVQWEVRRLIYDPGTNPSVTGGMSSGDACGYFSSSNRASCTVVPGSNGSGSRVFPTGTTQPNASQLTQNIPPLDPGAKVCYVLSISPWKNRPGVAGGSDWRHSNMICVIVAKKPKLHVLDGDLKVHGSVSTSTSTISSKTYGSWVDYGVFSVGQNGDPATSGNAISSGAGLRNGFNGPSANWSKLTFANTPTLGNFTLGTFSSVHDYFMDQPQTQTAGSPLTLSGTGVKIINAGTNVTINASSIPLKGTFIVKTSGTVTIAGDITYDTGGSVTNIGDIPQVVIVADNINIRSGVKRIDAWLLASGTINTCSDKPAGNLTANICNQPLVVNGPVSANALHVYRTAGATKTNPEEPAETFRLTPTTYLWAFDFTNQADRVKTTYVTEEAPRF